MEQSATLLRADFDFFNLYQKVRDGIRNKRSLIEKQLVHKFLILKR